MEQRSVLIVDDEPAVRTSVSKALSNAGYQTQTADSGNEALKILEKNTFDVVLSDLQMPMSLAQIISITPREISANLTMSSWTDTRSSR